ncbi:Hpt domain-containing protein [Vibrio sp. 99-70-13A1]|uniref:Hpt domain-containing protein n=1 Tax=Vibrio sp. 99-70-13A1 TaxID=2607601 RepID=UPI001493CCFE|nr:Hpt domain-containing protein [Vibrio sp. 99-70-13A1]NOH98399.1 Hpt domain-containing protein [Vibrio sp. 99-70-13A1]
MELSVTIPQKPSIRLKLFIIIAFIWLLPSLTLLHISRSYNQSLESVEELGTRIIELRQSIYHEEPLRITRVNNLALDAQLVYSIRLQIESEFKDSWFLPDINQLLYSTDQFLEKFNEFSPLESQLQNLVSDIKLQRSNEQSSEYFKRLLNELGVVVFEAIYSDSQSSPAIYRTFDSILEASYDLDLTEQQEIQKMLAEGSGVLGDYARLNYIIEKMKQNSAQEQIILVEAKFHEGQFYFLLGMTAINFVSVFSVIALFTLAKVASQREESPPASSTSDKHTDSILQNHIEELSQNTLSNLPNNRPSDVSSNIEQSGVSYSNDFPAKSSIQDSSSLFDGLNPENCRAKQVMSAQEINMTGANSSSTNDSTMVIDIPAMLENLDDDEESVALLLSVFIQDHAQDADKFKRLLAEDLVSALRVVHSLKGVAGSIKADRLGTISSSIELALKQSNLVSEADLKELADAICATVKAAQEYVSDD